LVGNCKKDLITGSRYIICGAQYKMKMWAPFLKMLKNFKVVKARITLNAGTF
jgi:hypothetical protein